MLIFHWCKLKYNVKSFISKNSNIGDFLSLEECYKIVFNLNGLDFSNYFELCRNTKSRSNNPYKLQTKLAKSNCSKNSFFVRIIKPWNDLPINVFNFSDSPNVSKFKLRLRNHMNIYWMAILYLFMILICFLSDFFKFLLTSFYKDLKWFYIFSLGDP